jgi:hypothetical protein
MEFILDKTKSEIVIPAGKHEVFHSVNFNHSVYLHGPIQMAGTGPTLIGRHAFISVENENANVTIEDVNFEQFGESVVSFRGAKLIVKRCHFRRNAAPSVGGAAIFADAQSVEISDCVFEENTGRQGGALLFSGLTEVVISRCSFKQNASIQGGAIRVREGALVKIVDCLFENNRALSETSFAAKGASIFASGTTSRKPVVKLLKTTLIPHVDSVHGDLHAESGAQIETL